MNQILYSMFLRAERGTLERAALMASKAVIDQVHLRMESSLLCMVKTPRGPDSARIALRLLRLSDTNAQDMRITGASVCIVSGRVLRRCRTTG